MDGWTLLLHKLVVVILNHVDYIINPPYEVDFQFNGGVINQESTLPQCTQANDV